MEGQPAGGVGRRWSWLAIIVVVSVPAILVRLGVFHTSVPVETLTFGLAVVSAAFVLTWSAEAAEHDISQALALTVLALIAVLPEYAVDMTYAWKAGKDPAFEEFAVANMTGGNRLLVGLGWASVVFIYCYRRRTNLLELAQSHRLELGFLALATTYSFILPLKGNISLADTVVLILLFGAYVFLAARQTSEEPDLMGPAKTIGDLPRMTRRTVLLLLFAFSGGMIILSAEPFAEGLVHTGSELGIDEFLLVQWLAPLASEAPEFIAAGMLAWRLRGGAGMAALVSSKVNQWTLLIGGLPIAYALSRGGLHALPLHERQVEEVFLTAAQSAFALAVIASLSVSLIEGGMLAVLFLVQAAIPNTHVRMGFAVVYLVLAAGMLIHNRQHVIPPLVNLWNRLRARPALR